VDVVAFLERLNLFDILIAFFVAGFFVVGYIQGTLRRVLGLAIALLSLLVALNLRDPLGAWLAQYWTQLPRPYVYMLAFGGSALTIYLAGSIAAQTFYRKTTLFTKATVVDELVGGVRFRISGKAFFQINTAGAEQLVQLVARALEQTDRTGTLVDGYAGGGLFAATVGSGFDTVVAVESDPTAVSDLTINCSSARVVAVPVEEAFERLPARVEAVVVDPPRQGLGRVVVEGIVARSPSVVVSVSCDPASAARDSRLLVDAGYSLDWVQPVDLFPQTPHIETVSRFSR